MNKSKKQKPLAKSIEQEHNEFFEQFRKQDDRSAVILAGALVDLFLGALLRKALLPSPSTKDALLDDEERGPLSSLYAKSLACHRLGLIDNDMLQAINVLRDVRNRYAHRLEYSDLNTEPYSSKIREAYSLFSWYEPFINTGKILFGSNETGSMQFRLVAALVALRLKQAIDEQSILSTSTPKTLISAKWEVIRLGLQFRASQA
jgi:hypothetical protein